MTEIGFVTHVLCDAMNKLKLRAAREDAVQAMGLFIGVHGMVPGTEATLGAGLATLDRYGGETSTVNFSSTASITGLGVRTDSPEAWAMAVDFFTHSGGKHESHRALKRLAAKAEYVAVKRGTQLILDGGRNIPAEAAEIIAERARDRCDAKFAARVSASMFARAE
ncbi:Uncharacterised protein [uncultured archaeon]|nr:Uncharacterised protein [uncultured archaeon]